MQLLTKTQHTSNTIKALINDIFLYSYLLPLAILIILLLKKKVRPDILIVAILIYFPAFFFLNFYYSELKILLTRKGYYFTYTFLEYISFSVMLYYIVSKKKFRKIIISCSALFTIFLIINYSFSTIKRIDSIPIGVETILLFIYIFYYYFNSLAEIENTRLYKKPEFWFVIGMLVYLSSTFFFNILAESLDSNFMTNYWHFTFIGDILKNILFAFGILFYLRKGGKEKEKAIDNLLSI